MATQASNGRNEEHRHAYKKKVAVHGKVKDEGCNRPMMTVPSAAPQVHRHFRWQHQQLCGQLTTAAAHYDFLEDLLHESFDSLRVELE